MSHDGSQPVIPFCGEVSRRFGHSCPCMVIVQRFMTPYPAECRT